MDKEILLIPGPTPIPSAVARAMSTEMFNHRGPRFEALLAEVTVSLKRLFQTEGRLFILTASGTGAMEAALVNFLSPGQKIISLVNGAFSERLAQIGDAFGMTVIRLESEWGRPLDYRALEKMLREDTAGEIKAVTVVHNESSTGMMNDVEEISRLRGAHPALLIVDTISSMGAVDFPVDRWRVDVCFTGSQKALMLPPGLAVISAGERAWQAAGRAKASKYYFSLQKAQEYLDRGQTPFTPAVSQVVALKEGLKLYFAGGREQCFARHRRMAGAARAAMRALGLELLVEDRHASMTVTAVRRPEGIDVPALCSLMRERFGVVIAAGQGRLSGKIFRLGHLGAVTEMELLAGIAALEMALKTLGMPLELGRGVRAAEEFIMAWD